MCYRSRVLYEHLFFLDLRTFCLLLILVLISPSALGAVINVPADQPSIQDGIDAAVDGDTVLLADGVYSGAGNEDISFHGKAITVTSENGPDHCFIQPEGPDTGGFIFDSSETHSSRLEKVCLRHFGSQSSVAVKILGSSSPVIFECVFLANSYHFQISAPTGNPVFLDCVFRDNVDSKFDRSTIIESMAITFDDCLFENNLSTLYPVLSVSSGDVEISNCTFSYNCAVAGGAVYLENSSGILSNCFFNNNISYHHDKGGGAVCVENDEEIVLFDTCTFNDNSAVRGGGLYAISANVVNCSFISNEASRGGGGLRLQTGRVENCTFSENSSGTNGGGLLSIDAEIDQCTFQTNLAEKNGGGLSFQNSNISNSDFRNNEAVESGGGIYSSAQGFDNQVAGCTFSENSANSGGGGSLEGCTIKQCIIQENSATEGGGLFCDSSLVENSLFYSNHATDGGAISSETLLTIQNCTVVDNDVSDQGGAIYFQYPTNTLTIVNSVFWGNGEKQIDSLGGLYLERFITYSCVENYFDGKNNVNSDPLFIGEDDYHLKPLSPCINSGTNNGAPDIDLDGRSRPFGSDCDMGAYEFPYPEGYVTVDLEMPSNSFKTGSICSCTLSLECSMDEPIVGFPVFAILDAYGQLFFAPEFNDFSYFDQIYQPGSHSVTILPEFTWPSGSGQASGILWYAAMTNPQFTELVSNLDTFEFGWE